MGDLLLKVADKLGIPVAILVVIGIAFWQSAGWIATNVVTPLVNSHTILINEIRETNRSDSGTLKVIAETQADISKTQHEIMAEIKQRPAK